MLYRDSIGFRDTLWDISSGGYEQITGTPAQDFTGEIMRDPYLQTYRGDPKFWAPFGNPKIYKYIYIYTYGLSYIGEYSGVPLFRKIPYCNSLLVLQLLVTSSVKVLDVPKDQFCIVPSGDEQVTVLG